MHNESGQQAQAILPTIEALHELATDAQGAVYGARLRYEDLEAAARNATEDALLKALQDHALEVRLGALLITTRAARHAAAISAALVDALVRNVGDAAVWTLAWGERPHQRKLLPAASLAVEALTAALQRQLNLRRMAAWRERASGPQAERAGLPEAEDALARAIERAAELPASAELLQTLLRAPRQLFQGHDRPDAQRRLAEQLAATALDPQRFAHVRWGALAALDRALRRGDADPDALTPARDAALRGGADALNDPAADLHLRRRVREELAALAPELVAELLAAGTLAPAPLPNPARLLGRHGLTLSAEAQAAALQVTGEAVADGLALGRSPAEAVAAAALAPVVAQRDGGALILEALLAAVARADLYTREDDGRTVSIEVGAFAAERLLQLLAPGVRRGEPHALNLYLRALTACVERGLDRQLRPASPLSRYMDATRWSAAGREDVRAHLLALAANPQRPPEVRFAALLAERSPEANHLAAAILRDPAEDDRLRALIGLRLGHWCPEAPRAWVLDPEAPLWEAHHDLPPLPISEPGARVPLAWLLASLSLSMDTIVDFTAVRHISARLSRRGAHDLDAPTLAALRAAASPELLQHLREIVDLEDEDASPAAPRWGACMILAVLGDTADIPRLASYMARRGAWSRLDPFSEEAANAELLDHVTLHPLALEHPRSLLEPFLHAGYGPEHAQRIVAEAFVRLGQRALQEGLPGSAQRAFARARHLDPLNIAARRATR